MLLLLPQLHLYWQQLNEKFFTHAGTVFTATINSYYEHNVLHEVADNAKCVIDLAPT